MKSEEKKKVVIVGGGFAGVQTALKLSKDSRFDITLINNKSYFQYYPALYKIVTGALAIETTLPLETIFEGSGVSVLVDTYTGFDSNESVVHVEENGNIHYDFLVLALGSQVNYFGIKGLEDFSHGFMSVREAVKLKYRLYHLFDGITELSKEDQLKRLRVTIVGAGPSGVELAGDIKSYLSSLAKKHNISPSMITIDLIQAADRVLPMFPQKVSARVEKRLRKLGVNIFLNRALSASTAEEIFVQDMSLASDTVVWTAGMRLSESFITTLPSEVFSERKKVKVDEYFMLEKNVFVLGDGAEVKTSGLAQGAISHGNFLAQHLRRIVSGKKLAPYVPKSMKYVVPVGNYWAVFVFGKYALYGFFPWVMRSLVDLRYFISITSLRYVLRAFFEGQKYRTIHADTEHKKECENNN